MIQIAELGVLDLEDARPNFAPRRTRGIPVGETVRAGKT
jgi:hypothetical protein